MTGLADSRRQEPERHIAPWLFSGLAAPLATALFGGSAAAWLLPVMRPYRHQLAFLLLLGLFAAGLGLVPPYLSKLVIDHGLMAGNTDALIGWSVMLFIIGLAVVGLGAFNNILHMRTSVRMLADLRRRLLDALIAKPPRWFAGQRAGELLARIDGDAGEVQQFAFNAVLGGLSSLVRLVGGTAMMMVLNWKLGLAAAILAPVELAFLIWARPHTEHLAGTARAARGQLTAGLSETLHGLPALQIAKGTGWARTRSLSDQAQLNSRLLIQQRWGEFTRAVPQVLSALMRACIFVAGGIMVIRGDWPLGSLIAFIAYLGFMIGPMQSLLGLWHAQARAKVALARLDALIGPPDHPGTSVPVQASSGFALKLESVTYGRTEAGAGALGPVSLDIPQGTKLALTGPSGIGKTSLLMLILGRERPPSGTLSLGGARLDALSPDSLGHRITFVSQRPFIARASLRENLFLPATLWDDDDTEPHVWDLLEILGLAARFRAAQGLNTLLGENGLTLSGGELQRICLARALLEPFDILILDEALSEVDPDRVAAIMAYIDQTFSTSTRIITTHAAMGAYGQFDRVLDLADGSK